MNEINSMNEINVQLLAAEPYLKIASGERPRTIIYEYTKTWNYIRNKICTASKLNSK